MTKPATPQRLEAQARWPVAALLVPDPGSFDESVRSITRSLPAHRHHSAQGHVQHHEAGGFRIHPDRSGAVLDAEPASSHRSFLHHHAAKSHRGGRRGALHGRDGLERVLRRLSEDGLSSRATARQQAKGHQRSHGAKADQGGLLSYQGTGPTPGALGIGTHCLAMSLSLTTLAWPSPK